MIRERKPPAGATQVEIRVPFHHVDILRVVWHGRYLEYLEAAQGAFLRERGLDLADMEALGYAFVVAETHVRHLLPLRYGDAVRVSCWLENDESRIDMAYELAEVATGRRCAVARVHLVTVTAQGDLCMATPEPILERLRRTPRRSHP
ncbi:MAG TPA: thioesterase family protein [Anaeromyxobacteraceae bacterium]|nr:thioesterase family protein [Anaeromyxobacteraceae bacterium]